jgi:hypothetical protein
MALPKNKMPMENETGNNRYFLKFLKINFNCESSAGVRKLFKRQKNSSIQLFNTVLNCIVFTNLYLFEIFVTKFQ